MDNMIYFFNGALAMSGGFACGLACVLYALSVAVTLLTAFVTIGYIADTLHLLKK